MPSSHWIPTESLVKMYWEYLMFVKKCKAIAKIIFDLLLNNSQEFPEIFDCWAFCLLEAVTGSVITQEYWERFGWAISVSTSSENLSPTNRLLPLGIKTQRLSSADATISQLRSVKLKKERLFNGWGSPSLSRSSTLPHEEKPGTITKELQLWEG